MNKTTGAKWIEHNPKKGKPNIPEGFTVDCELSNGECYFGCHPDTVDWEYVGNASVSKYRLHEAFRDAPNIATHIVTPCVEQDGLEDLVGYVRYAVCSGGDLFEVFEDGSVDPYLFIVSASGWEVIATREDFDEQDEKFSYFDWFGADQIEEPEESSSGDNWFTLEELQAMYQTIDIDHIDISIMDKLWDMIERYEET